MAESKFNGDCDKFVRCDGELATECIAFEDPFQDRLRELCVARSVQQWLHRVHGVTHIDSKHVQLPWQALNVDNGIVAWARAAYHGRRG